MGATARRRTKLALMRADARAFAAASPGKHEIATVEAFPLREPVSRRAYTIIRVQTTSGLTGHGECAGASAADLDQLKRTLIGRPATAYVGADLGTPAAAAATVAMLDIVGQACAAPLYRVLGGPTRYKVRVMATLDGSGDAELAASLSSGFAAGFRAFQVPCPVSGKASERQAGVRKVRARLESLRAAAAEDMDFALDGGAALSIGDAASIAAEMESFHLLWFDEPCSLDKREGIRRLINSSVMPLGFGRTVRDAGGFQNLLREGLIDVARPDLAYYGILSARRIAALAETYYVAVAPHHDGGPIGTAAALHLAASLPNFFIQHVPLPRSEADRAMRAALVSAPVEIVNGGFAQLPEGAGLGISVNESALGQYKDTHS
jgi:galactonate dehydratase